MAIAIGLPNYPPILKHFDNNSTQASAKSFYPVARLQFRGFTKAFDDFHHGLAVQHPGDEMGYG